MITPHYFKTTRVKVFTPDGTLICIADEHTLTDIQEQIARQNLDGYYIDFKGNKININSKGELAKWPQGMFDLSQVLFARLFRARTGKEVNGVDDKYKSWLRDAPFGGEMM